MGRPFGRRPQEGDRPGSGVHKYIKEIKRGRVKLASTDNKKREDLLKRLHDLSEIPGSRYTAKFESRVMQFVNFLVSCPMNGLVNPDYARDIHRMTDLQSPDARYRIDRRMEVRVAQCGPDLPLHYIAKLLGTNIPSNPADRYVHVVKNHNLTPDCAVQPVRNLKNLEYFLAQAVSRIKPGSELSVRINGKAFSYLNSGFNCDLGSSEHDNEFQQFCRKLRQASIDPCAVYELQDINSGGQRVASKILIKTTTPLLCRNTPRRDNEEQETKLAMFTYVIQK